jgi:hypothetical protein
MFWAAYSTVFLLSTIKFMFAPFSGWALGLTYFETFFTCAVGGSISAAFFFFSAGALMKNNRKKKFLAKKQALEQGIPYVEKNKFTWMNKNVVRLKRSVGVYGICFWAPFFLSVPIGSIITAKFYGHLKKAYPLIVFGMFLNSFIMTSLAYIFH